MRVIECQVCHDTFEYNVRGMAPLSHPECAPQRQATRNRFKALAAKGFTEESWSALLAAQGGRCAICRDVPSRTRDFHVDHDHACCPGARTCGKCTRGLLCFRCNNGLGLFQDRADVMAAAVAYLNSTAA